MPRGPGDANPPASHSDPVRAWRGLSRPARRRGWAFGNRKRGEISGGGGGPPTSKYVASAIVPPIDVVRQSHVHGTRRWNRAAAPRKSAKKRRSGRPSFAEPLEPGTGKANDSVEKTCCRWWTISC